MFNQFDIKAQLPQSQFDSHPCVGLPPTSDNTVGLPVAITMAVIKGLKTLTLLNLNILFFLNVLTK